MAEGAAHAPGRGEAANQAPRDRGTPGPADPTRATPSLTMPVFTLTPGEAPSREATFPGTRGFPGPRLPLGQGELGHPPGTPLSPRGGPSRGPRCPDPRDPGSRGSDSSPRAWGRRRPAGRRGYAQRKRGSRRPSAGWRAPSRPAPAEGLGNAPCATFGRTKPQTTTLDLYVNITREV